MTRFQKIAIAALVSVLILVFVGAIVRVSGAGMGCPDWPTCWGCIMPPWKVEQVNWESLDIQDFRDKAERMGRDPEDITRDSLRESFNPRHVWTEFVNRLWAALAVGPLSLATFVAAFGQPRRRWVVWWTALLSLLLVLINAWMGARVVYSGLQPGVLTLHMAMAMLLICLLAFTAWRGSPAPWALPLERSFVPRVRLLVGGLLFLIVAEGIMGTQIRELTDEMQKFHGGAPRAEWIGELEQKGAFLAHRSFSWLILAGSILAWNWTKKGTSGRQGWPANVTLGIVLIQMVLGLVMSQVQIYPAVQVLHVGLAGILLASSVVWFCGTWRIREGSPARGIDGSPAG